MKNVQSVLLGKYEVETWYFSPYPDDYSKLDKVNGVDRHLFLSPVARSDTYRSLCAPIPRTIPAPFGRSFACSGFGVSLISNYSSTWAPYPTPLTLPHALPLPSLNALAWRAPTVLDVLFFFGAQLFVCEFCLKYMRKEATLSRHRQKCPMRYVWSISFDAP